MFLKLFNTENEVAFAKDVVLNIKQKFPLAQQAAVKNTTKQNKKAQSRVAGLASMSKAFAENNPLNIYKKSKLLNAVKWGLMDEGYDEVFINEVIALLTHQFQSSGKAG